MKTSTVQTALVASAWLLSAGFVAAEPVAMAEAAATTGLVLKAMTFKGCYSKPDKSDPLQDKGPYTYQSSGYCQTTCVAAGHSVMALWKGSNCLCGDELPPESAKVEDSQCDIGCDGWPQEDCGGKTTYSVYLTGTDDDPATFSSSSSTSTTNGGTSTSTDGTSVITEAGKTIVVTAASQAEDDVAHKGSGGTNTAAIAAGVVVGVVGLCSLLGAAFFFFRHKKRKAVEEEYRRNAAINSFTKPMSTSSMSDPRFDGEFMAQRRQSNGSIDENQDYSRRVLQVTNPDR